LNAKIKVIADTGLLVALLDRSNKHHKAATRWLRQFSGTLVSVEPVLTETSFFLNPENTAKLIDQIAAGWIELHSPDAIGYGRIATLLRKYAELDPDLSDIALVWLAEVTGIKAIVTVDVTDFSTYRINGKSKFELIPWQSANWLNQGLNVAEELLPLSLPSSYSWLGIPYATADASSPSEHACLIAIVGHHWQNKNQLNVRQSGSKIQIVPIYERENRMPNTTNSFEIDWTGCELVERVFGKVSGRPVVRGTRILADTIVQDAELGSTLEEIQENYPDLSMSSIQQLVAFARSRPVHTLNWPRKTRIVSGVGLWSIQPEE
jgi:uncharacterized protein